MMIFSGIHNSDISKCIQDTLLNKLLILKYTTANIKKMME